MREKDWQVLQILESSKRDFKITIISFLKAPKDKIDEKIKIS